MGTRRQLLGGNFMDLTVERAIVLLSQMYLPQFDEEEKKALSMAIYALEKTDAKKPTYEGDGYDENGSLIYDTWICPYCDERYEVDYDNYKHCPECGQAIDRSDTE